MQVAPVLELRRDWIERRLRSTERGWPGSHFPLVRSRDHFHDILEFFAEELIRRRDEGCQLLPEGFILLVSHLAILLEQLFRIVVAALVEIFLPQKI